MTTSTTRARPKQSGGQNSQSSRLPSPSPAIILPLVHTTMHLPPPEHAAYYAGVAVLVALEVIEWPVALVVAAGHALASRSHNQVVEGVAEAAEDS